MAASNKNRFRVRYQYDVKIGTDPKTKEATYKTKSGNRAVTTDKAEPSEKELVAILEESHRKVHPVNLRIKSYQPEADPYAPKAAQASPEQEQRIATLELKVALLEESVKNMMEVISSGPANPPEDPKEDKPPAEQKGGSKKS